MAYDQELADRVRDMLREQPGLREKRMFGGVAFLVNGTMAVAASSEGGLLLRADPARAGTLADTPQVRPAEMRGRLMNGWLRIDAQVVATDDDLRVWVDQAVAYARSLPST